MMRMLITKHSSILKSVLFWCLVVFSSIGYGQNDNVISLSSLFEEMDSDGDWKLINTPTVIYDENRLRQNLDDVDYIPDLNFLKSIHAPFLSENDSFIVDLSVFLFSSQINSFGFYCLDKSPSNLFFDIGFEAYLTREKLVTWYGEFIITVMITDTIDQKEDHLKKMTKKMIDLLPQQKRATPILDAFPENSYVDKSVEFHRGRWLDQEYFDTVYYADYYTSDGYSRIFIIDNRTTEKADINFWRYYEFIKVNANVINDKIDLTTDYFIINEPVWGKTILAKKNQIIYGILDFQNKGWTEDRLAEILKKLKRNKVVKEG